MAPVQKDPSDAFPPDGAPFPLAASAPDPEIERALLEAVRLAGVDPAQWSGAVEALGRTIADLSGGGAASAARPVSADGSAAAAAGVALRGLTATEAAVVLALAEGLTPDEIAAHRGVSVHTVRNQIKAALAKTGTRRQADLMLLAERARGGR